MSWNRFICLCLVFSVVALSVCFVPVGRGPFSATHGPLTKFQAIQWLLLLLFLMAATIATPVIGAARLSIIFGLAAPGISPQVDARPPADSVLRC